jgi:DNA ligase D
MSRDETTVGGVRLTSPDKVLYPEQGITKRELAEYYLAVAGRILKHLARRPITMVRCPTGRQKTCFYQRHAGSGVPEEISQIAIEGFDEPYLYIGDEAGLVALVQMGVLEVHPWNARTDRPDRPDRIVFDLDPGEGLSFADVVEAAHEVRAALDQVGLGSFAKTTGGKGIHVVVPIERTAGWDEAKAFAKALAAALAEARSSSTTCATIPPRRRWRPTRHGRGREPPSPCRSPGKSSTCRSIPAASICALYRSSSSSKRSIHGRRLEICTSASPSGRRDCASWLRRSSSESSQVFLMSLS